ncbi:hypothetical protein BO78DRAFT_395533 [Aspergillus sclerotiicarbonarius CBS 121057]|uniref:Uncharacterized protein n=1 Tax=Aspergillus sclerotiicarbonarius (strain CBS 121057 / IBT 28362) TaxID=1448318 RepID=A0A319FKM5_ASPSB|nr:hypothetical protein BO78DRAFT_395533 [Aspergillus sclerotiicarbonarius CBS 121057]
MDATLPDSKAITNTQIDQSATPESNVEKAKLQVVEIDFSKPQPGENLNVFWKPARAIIRQKAQDWLDYSSNPAVEGTSS